MIRQGYILLILKSKDMKRILTILILSLLLHYGTFAQTVVVNPNGTHSTVINNGSTSTIVNPDGTHSTLIYNGNISTIVNPNGTHSTIITNGNTWALVNPDGTHSTLIYIGNMPFFINIETDFVKTKRIDRKMKRIKKERKKKGQKNQALNSISNLYQNYVFLVKIGLDMTNH